MNRSLTQVAVIFAALVGCSCERPTPASVPAPAPNGSAMSELRPADTAAPTPAPSSSSIASNLADPDCLEQTAQEFLQRAHLNYAPKSRAERAEMLKVRAQAIGYRTAHYGYFEGFGDRSVNPKSPAQQAKVTSFFGLPVAIHERVIPALRCVERQLERDCAEYKYKPSNLSGLRKKNTYIDGEVSNHVYGIAIDIDPLKNPCCKCLEPWSSSERCRGKKTVWERMAMPECWVTTFERFGFYWLGHDVLEDTMHFEFLGDPEQILRHSDLKSTHAESVAGG